MIVVDIPEIPLHPTGSPHQVETEGPEMPCQQCNLIWVDLLELNLLLPMIREIGIETALLLLQLDLHMMTDVPRLPKICL